MEQCMNINQNPERALADIDRMFTRIRRRTGIASQILSAHPRAAE